MVSRASRAKEKRRGKRSMALRTRLEASELTLAGLCAEMLFNISLGSRCGFIGTPWILHALVATNER